MLERARSWRIGLFLGLVAALTAVEVRAADTGNGSKNFTAPRSVPNYFSNEAGPMLGPASETQRGPLYMRQTYGTPAQTQRAFAAPPSRYARQHIAMAEPRGRLIRMHGRRVVAHHVIVHGRTRVVAHGSSHSHREYHRVSASHYAGHVNHHARATLATRASRRTAHISTSHHRRHN
ncbi:MAG TPA: hypothetical protein VMI30_01720 [Stellaceae bacterium]|nr:hypothetical protein [Stellaceae bacterium]